jgi:hypothetical protein
MMVYLVMAAAVGFAAIAANLILSTWHAKAKARKLMRRRLDEFDVTFQEQIINRVAHAEHALQRMSARGRNVSERLEAIYARVVAQRQSLSVKTADATSLNRDEPRAPSSDKPLASGREPNGGATS